MEDINNLIFETENIDDTIEYDKAEIEVFPRIYWPAINKPCDFAGCWNNSYNSCNLKLNNGMSFKGCGRNICMSHTNLVIGKHPIFYWEKHFKGYTCIDENCVYKFSLGTK